MVGKLIITVTGLALLVSGGALAIKYGTSWFNDYVSSTKIKIWLDDKGQCQYKANILSFSLERQDKEEKPNGDSQPKKEVKDGEGNNNWCLRLLDENLESKYANIVEIDQEQMDTQYKTTITTKEAFRNHLKKPSS